MKALTEGTFTTLKNIFRY